MTKEQQKAFDEMGTLLMKKLNISSEKATELILKMMQGFSESLDKGILKNNLQTYENTRKNIYISIRFDR